MSDHAAVYHTYNDHVLSSYKKGKKAPQKKYKSSSYDLTNIIQVFWWRWKCCVRNKQHLSQYSMLNQSKIFIMIFSVISSLRLNRKDSWHYFSPKCVQDLFFCEPWPTFWSVLHTKLYYDFRTYFMLQAMLRFRPAA